MDTGLEPDLARLGVLETKRLMIKVLCALHHLGPIDHRPGAPGLRVLEPLLILPALPRPGELLVEAIEVLKK